MNVGFLFTVKEKKYEWMWLDAAMVAGRCDGGWTWMDTATMAGRVWTLQ